MAKRKTKKKAARRKNPSKVYYLIFRCDGNRVSYLSVNSTWVGRRNKSKLLSESRFGMERLAGLAQPAYQTSIIGVADTSATEKEIIAKCKAAGKARARRSNPVGPTRREKEDAGQLFKDFTGHNPQSLQRVKLNLPKVGLVVGQLDGVLYTTVRDGKRESYIHEFEKRRPLLVSSHDGKSLHILGGEYEFTERGIVG